MSSNTASPLQPIAEMYGRWTLDCVIDLAHAVSHDFVARPRHYRQVPDDVADILTRFRMSTGSDVDWPNAFQRSASYGVVLRSICRNMVSLRAGATKAASEGGVQMQRRALLDEVSTLQSSIKTIEGRATSAQDRLTRGIFENAVKVLRCEEVARAFGLPPAPGDGWPLGGNFSGDAAYLCEEIDKRLVRLGTPGTMSQQKFIVLQRVAHYGTQTISRAIGEPINREDVTQLDEQMQLAYSWAAALRDLLPGIDIARAWKDQEYRLTLTSAERDLLPSNPAGNIEFEGTGLEDVVVAGGPTMTVGGEVCCCSGDFCDDDPTITFDCHTRKGVTCMGFTCNPGCDVVVA